MLSDLEKRIIASVQGDIPIVERPYLEISKRLEIGEDEFLDTLRGLCEKGIIRRFGATIRHQKSGFYANAMAAWQVEEHRIEEVGKQMASFRQVSHCYRRNPTDSWPYNLYTMIHSKSEAECWKIARKMAQKAGVFNFTLLFSKRELKKTSMKYFSRSCESRQKGLSDR
jgi:DNA-binding Lrp family transcriptional regulator